MKISGVIMGALCGTSVVRGLDLTGTRNPMGGLQIEGNNFQPVFFTQTPSSVSNPSTRSYTVSDPSNISPGIFACVDGKCGHTVDNKPLKESGQSCVLSGDTLYCK